MHMEHMIRQSLTNIIVVVIKLNTEDMGTKVIRIFGISAKLLYSRMQRNGKTRCLPVV